MNNLATGKIADKNKLKDMDGKPVYKIRCGTKNMGARSGARIIYYKDDSKLIALHIYVKNDRENVPSKEIMTFLKENGL
ncbi:MAG: type II toxin-antitoxin system RelE/ParE family toxin [Bacteroidetes bacterium]|nr:type II toxin-antitoxin system RelE/ParE family toxin [Bacteroidota bacterium]